MNYLVRLELETEGETLEDAAREFFTTVHTDHDYQVEVRDEDENLKGIFTKTDLEER